MQSLENQTLSSVPQDAKVCTPVPDLARRIAAATGTNQTRAPEHLYVQPYRLSYADFDAKEYRLKLF